MTSRSDTTNSQYSIFNIQLKKGIQYPASSIFLQNLVHPYHPNYEAQNQSGAYEDNQIGCKEGHYEGIGVFQFIASDQDKDAKG